MITLFASLVGFIGSIVPEIIKLFKDHKNKKHELEIIDRQIEHKKYVKPEILNEIQISRQLIEQASLYSTYKSGVTWVDALNGTVRPVLAYFFFIIYAIIKFVQYRVMSLSGSIMLNIDAIWSNEDQAIFAGIISFYFGQRTFSKIGKSKR